MPDTHSHMNPNEDPFYVLGVDPEAGDEEIRTAYLERVRAYPPDRAPEQFERIRDAYEALKDPRARVLHLLQSLDPEIPFPSLLKESQKKRHLVGPDPWLDAMRER